MIKYIYEYIVGDIMEDNSLFITDIDGIINELLCVNNDIKKNIIASLEGRWISDDSTIFIEKVNNVCMNIKNVTLMLDSLKKVYKIDTNKEDNIEENN